MKCRILRGCMSWSNNFNEWLLILPRGYTRQLLLKQTLNFKRAYQYFLLPMNKHEEEASSWSGEPSIVYFNWCTMPCLLTSWPLRIFLAKGLIYNSNSKELGKPSLQAQYGSFLGIKPDLIWSYSLCILSVNIPTCRQISKKSYIWLRCSPWILNAI